MGDALATRGEVAGLRTALETQASELNQYRRDAQDREERFYAALQRETLARQKAEFELIKKMNHRTRLEVAIVGAIAVFGGVLAQTFSAHSYAQATLKVEETNRLARAAELEQLKAHDDLVIKRTLDERDARDVREGVVILRTGEK